MRRHDCTGNVDTCFTCRIKTVSVSPSATPTRNVGPPPPPGEDTSNNWEKGIKTETRPDGSVMPWISSETLQPIPIKKYTENRRAYDQARERVANT